MSIKKWKVTAELNMDASDYKNIEVSANIERKAIKFAEEIFKKQGAFHVKILNSKEIL